MKTIIVSSDQRLAGQLRAALLDVEPALRCQVLAPADPIPLCALYILCVPADGLAIPVQAPNAGAVQWRVDFGTGTDAAAPEFAWDDCFTWPLGAGQWAHHLAQARSQLRARSGLAERKVLDLALQRVVELAAESIEVVDPSIRLLYANPAFEQVTGWAMEDAVGFTTGELFRAGTHDPAYYADIGATLRAGNVWRGPLVARRRDGVLSFQQATLAPVKDESDATVAFVAIKHDAERDSVAKSAGQSSGQRLQTMIEDAADAFLVHDAQGAIVDVNARACHMLGCTRAHLLAGQRLQDFAPPQERARMEQVFAALQPGEPQTLETHFTPAGGAALPVGLRVGVFSFGGERFVLTLARDISERVALEATLRRQSEELGDSLRRLQATQRELVQREKHVALGTLVAGVAHDVNTPLGVTLTALSLAREHLQSVEAALDSARPSRHLIRERMAELDNVLTVSLENAQRAADLISNFKKIAVDQASEVLRNVEMVDYLRAVAAHYAPTLRRARIEVNVKGEPVDVLTRPGAIAQVITNLMQNAVVHAFDESSSDRRVDITCSHDERQVQVSVRDNGKGMSAEVAGRIFDPFFTTRMGSGGSGLGMTIVHNLIVDMLQGAISIQTAPGQGLEVLISLPRQPVMTGAMDAATNSTADHAPGVPPWGSYFSTA